MTSRFGRLFACGAAGSCVQSLFSRCRGGKTTVYPVTEKDERDESDPDDQGERVDRVLRNGVVRGVLEGPVMRFRGVPFAAPPVGPLRFRRPQPVQPWKGPKDCGEWGPRSLQEDGEGCSEDCLYVDVTAPSEEIPGGHPVLVWIHGGGLTSGDGHD